MMCILLFLATNVAIMVVISIAISLLGLTGTLDAQGINFDLNALLVMSAIICMTGSIISSTMSKAKQAMGVNVIQQPQNQTEQRLLALVAKQAWQADIGMSEVAIFEAQEANAFITEMNKNAVSSGLLLRMSHDEVKMVIGHEITPFAICQNIS
jgi:heat shock protein HtpX